MKRFLLITLLFLFFSVPVLIRASDLSGPKNMDTSVTDLGACCDESCIEKYCKRSMERIYDYCGYGIHTGSKLLSKKEAQTYCTTDDYWQCIVVQTEKSNGHSVNCDEDGLDGAFDDQYREPEEICGNVKRNLKRSCELEVVGGKDFEKDDSEDQCGCGM